MNFTLTPGVYAALNLLSKATRSRVLEAAFAFVICGIRPTNLSKNLLVMFMMVVDSASEGKLTYVPEQAADEAPAEELAPARETEPEAAAETEPRPEPAPKVTPSGQTPRSTSLLRDYEMVRHPEFTKVKGMRRRIRSRREA